MKNVLYALSFVSRRFGDWEILSVPGRLLDNPGVGIDGTYVSVSGKLIAVIYYSLGSGSPVTMGDS